MIIKVLVILFSILTFLAVCWFVGPKVKYPKINNESLELSWSLQNIDNIILAKENAIEHLKEDNQARIVWHDSIPAKTEYSIVYLHGFSASQGEGHPIHREIAKEKGANLFLARLKDHGIESKEAFKNVTPQDWIDDAKEAIAIGKLIGDKVIVMSCSTGGTLSIYLAAADSSIAALILLSPNIEIYDQNSKTLTGPWGEILAHKIIGEYRLVSDKAKQQYWTGDYHINGLIALQYLIDKTMTDKIFSSIELPIFMGYYFKNKERQDKVVSVDAMQKFYGKISTDNSLKENRAFPEASNHVISSSLKNPNWINVKNAVITFLDDKLSMK